MSATKCNERAKAVFDLIRAVETNTKAGFERGKANPKKERAAVKKLLTLMEGKAPSESDIDLALSEIWPC
jgi:hypothetical protein